MTTKGREALRFEIHTNWDDPWGSALSNLGGLCDLLHVEGGDIPADAGYSPGACEPALEDYPAAMFVELLDDGTVSIEDCEYWARVLSKYADLVPEGKRY